MKILITFSSGGNCLLINAWILGEHIIGKLADGTERAFHPDEYESARSV